MNELCRLLRDPRTAEQFGSDNWDRLVAQVRAAGVAARLHARLATLDDNSAVPAPVADVLRGSATLVAYLQRRARYELSWLEAIASRADYPIVLLKGVAYLAGGLPCADGRALSDIDVLVPPLALDAFEEALRAAGWGFAEDLTPYDEYYYRTWSHELPPLRRAGAHFELDVHHALIQPTSRSHFDPSSLFERLVPVAGTPFFRLSDVDIILHSAVHLIQSDELRGGIGDVWDIALLCRHFGANEGSFWDDLAARAEGLGLERPAYYALDAARRLLGLTVPAAPLGRWRPLARLRLSIP